MDEALPVPTLEQLFREKNRILNVFLKTTQDYLQRFKDDQSTVESKMEWVDQLSDIREDHFRTIQAIDHQLAAVQLQMSLEGLKSLQQNAPFREALHQTLLLIREIQLTDQSLFLYIQNMGFELRAQILKGLKEKEALSKFKSQIQTATGEGLDHKV